MPKALLEPAPRIDKGVHPNKTFPKNPGTEVIGRFFGITANTPATGTTTLTFNPT